MKFSELLAQYPRLAITGAPRCGKTTLCEEIRDRAVIHTDDWKTWDWREVPFLVTGACSQHESFVVEGVRAADAIRNGLVVDAVLVLDTPKAEQTELQINMGTGIATVLAQVAQANPALPIIRESALEWPTVDRADVPVQRFAFVTLDRASNTVEPTGVLGGIRIIGVELAHPGVWEYNRGGRIVREYSPAEELFSPESLKTLQGVPVLVDHPYDDGGLVDSTTFRKHSVGHLENPRRVGDVLVGDLVINDAATVARVMNGELTEVSLGYQNIREWSPGVTPNGKPYDLIQRGQTYNHVAIGPDGWSRKDVGWSLDAKDNQILAAVPHGDTPMNFKALPTAPAAVTNDSLVPGAAALVTPAAPAAPAAPVASVDAPSMPSAADPAAPAPALSAEDIGVLKEIVAMLPTLRQLTNAGAPVPAMPTTDNAPTPVAAPEKEKTMDAADHQRLIAETVELHKEAERFLGDEYKPAGKSNREIRLDVIKTCDSKFAFDEKTPDAAITAAYGMAKNVIAERAKRTDSLAALHAGAFETTVDAGDEQTAESKSQSAWKTKV